MTVECEVCGNGIDPVVGRCPFCGSKVERAASSSRPFVHKTINLEQGRPVVEVALNRMDHAIGEATRSGVNVITLIHGYGSSGKGGKIRMECRKMLDYMKVRGRIQDYVSGENFNKRSAPVKALLRRYPQLNADRNLGRENRGVTLVIL